MRVTFDQCDSTEEIVGLFNKVFDNQEQMEAKIVQNAQEIEALKPKKKGKSKMKSKGSASMRIVAILVLIVALAGLGYAAYVPGDINYDIASNPESLVVYLRDVTNNMRSNTYVFTPRATPPLQPVEGMVYYNNVTDNWVGYVTETGWQNFDVAGGLNLNDAYDFGGGGLGRTINVNDNPVLLTNSDTDNTDILHIYHDGAGATRGILITIDGTEPAIEIENTSTGYDIEGTGAAWYATNTGQIVGLDLDLTGANGITLQNDETITNADGSIVFTESAAGNTLIFDLDDGATSILIDSGDVVTLNWGTVDNFTSVETITFDDAATSAISMTGTGTNNLLITQLGVGDESLVLNSAGSPVDAITIVASAGGIDIDAPLSITTTSAEDQPDAILIEATAGGIDILASNAGAGDDIDITATLSSVNITSTESDGNAIVLTASGANGGIVLQAAIGGIDFDATLGAITLDTTINAAPAISLITNGGAAETITITNTQGTTAGAIAITGTAGGISMDAVDDIIITVASSAAADDLALVQTGAFNASITLAAAGNGVDAIDLNASAGGIDIDAALAITIDNAAGDISFISAAGSVIITAVEAVEDAIVISSGGGIDISLVDDFDLVLVTDGADENLSITLTGGTASSIIIASSGTGTDAIDIDTTAGGIEIDMTGTAAGDDFAVTTSSSITFVTTEAVADQFHMSAQGVHAGDVINLETTNGGILLNANLANGTIELNANEKLTITSDDDTADGIDIGTTAGGGATSTIHIHNEAGTAVDSIEILTDNGGVTVTSNLASDDGININAVAGGVDIDAALQINITSSETAADAIVIDASDGGGGIDIDAGTAGINIRTTSGDLNFNTTGAAGDRIDLINTTGTGVSLAEAETAAIQLYATVGGIGLNSGINGANAIRIEADGGVNEIIMIHSNQGTGASTVTEVDSSIQLLSDIGGIGLQSGLDGADAIRLETRGGNSAVLMLHSNDGTGADSITLLSDEGGIQLDTTVGDIALTALTANGDITLSAKNTIILTAEDEDAGGILLTVDGDATSTLRINNITGTGAVAIELDTDAGGITLLADGDPAGKILIDAEDSITLTTEDDHAGAITITSAAGAAASTIIVTNVAGTAVSVAAAETAAIQLYSTVGGIGLNSGINAVNAIRIEADGGAAETIVIHANLGDTATSITLLSDDGGITLTPGKLVTLGGGTVHSGIQDVPAGGTSTVLVLTNTVFTVGADGGGDIMTLANGTAGQIVYIICEDGTGTTTITPTPFNGGTSITFDAVGDAVTLVYTTDLGWSIVGGNSYTII